MMLSNIPHGRIVSVIVSCLDNMDLDTTSNEHCKSHQQNHTKIPARDFGQQSFDVLNLFGCYSLSQE